MAAVYLVFVFRFDSCTSGMAGCGIWYLDITYEVLFVKPVIINTTMGGGGEFWGDNWRI